MSAAPTSPRMRYVAHPGTLPGGELQVPGDKSISHRALMLAGIARGTTRISGFLESEDCLATLRAMRALGVSVSRPGTQSVVVEGTGLRGLRQAPGVLDMGNAGTAMRLFTGLLAGQAFDSQLVGDSSLMKRPMERVAAPLRLMGADIRTHNGLPPVHVRGGRTLNAIAFNSPVASAQVKSAVLLAGLYAAGETSVTEPAPTRDHSERMLEAFGAQVRRQGSTVRIQGEPDLRACDIDVPADLSSAAFFLVAGALAARGPLTIRNVGINPSRAGVLHILRLMGAQIRLLNERRSGAEPVADLEVTRSDLRGVTVPAELVPLAIDEFPVIFAAAALAQGQTTVTGAAELRVKESDRIAVMADGLARLGAEVEVLADGLRIRGGSLRGGQVDSRGDHRIAMAFAVAGLRADGPVEIDDVANVATSFPDFVGTARGAGMNLQQMS